MITININIDENDLNSIKKAERKKAILENKGFYLFKTICGFNSTTLIYKSNEVTKW